MRRVQPYIKSDVADTTNMVQIAGVPANASNVTLTWSNGTVETGADIKVGKRNSKADTEKIQGIHDHAVSLGAMCDGGGDMSMMGGKNGASTAARTRKDIDSLKGVGLSLDALVSAVQEEFYDMREEMRMAAKPFGAESSGYWEWDDSDCPRCVAVYADHAIARIELAYFEVPFQIVDGEVELAPREEWKEVEQQWVQKNIDADVLALLDAQHGREVGVVKSLGGGRLGNYLVVWGDEQHRDLTGEYFTKSTEGLTAIFESVGKVPALYHHAMDHQIKYTPVGHIVKMEADDVGLWTETQLDLANKYAVAVQKLARKRALGASSGTLPAARKVDDETGEIKQWVIIEGSFTPTPAEPRLRELGVAEVKSLYEAAGLPLPDDWKATSDDTGGEESRPTDEREAIDVERERLELLELETIETHIGAPQ